MSREVGTAYGAAKGPDEQYPEYAKRVTALIGPDQTVRKVYTVTDVRAHPDEVLADIRELSG